MKIDIQALYESLLVGSCPCHGFTKVEGHTGGFYHIFCRHGVWVYYLQIITTPVLSTINISPFFKLSYLMKLSDMRYLAGHVWSCFLFPGHRCIEIFDPSRVCAGSCRLVSLLQALSIVIHMWHPMWFCQTYGLQGSWNNRALVGFFWRLFRRTLSGKDADKGALLILYSCCNFKVLSVNSCASSVVYT